MILTVSFWRLRSIALYRSALTDRSVEGKDISGAAGCISRPEYASNTLILSAR